MSPSNKQTNKQTDAVVFTALFREGQSARKLIPHPCTTGHACLRSYKKASSSISVAIAIGIVYFTILIRQFNQDLSGKLGRDKPYPMTRETDLGSFIMWKQISVVPKALTQFACIGI